MKLISRLDGKDHVKLSDMDPGATGGFSREEVEAKMPALLAELAELQELMYAAQETPVLIVLQGLDTSGKDGSIQHVMSSMNPQSCRVASFKVPTPLEASHDFLWRIHAETPGKGMLTIFNRSHYEDVLVVKVHKLISEEVCKARYDRINEFERLLTDSGTVILKFFLHISKDEQERRLLDREKDPAKAWKLSPADWRERELWDQYQEAYEAAINHCSKPNAPWFVVPANHKYYRNLVLASTIVEALRPHKANWVKRLEDIGHEELKLLRAQRQQH